MSESKQELYFGGIPTDPDVRRLRDKYPESKMTEGDFIPYTDVAELIHCGRKTDRFKTVTNRWRRIVQNETTHEIGTRPGEGFVVLTDAEKVDLCETKIVSAFRGVRRAMGVSGRINQAKLTEAQKARKDHADRTSAAVFQAGRLKSKSDYPKMTE